MTYLDGPRFVVRELEGYAKTGDGRALPGHHMPGQSFTVIDRAYCCAVMGVFRTEDLPQGNSRPREERAAKIRGRAQLLCDELNAKHA